VTISFPLEKKIFSLFCAALIFLELFVSSD